MLKKIDLNNNLLYNIKLLNYKMLKAILNFFGFGSITPAPVQTVLFDYKKYPLIYLSRCKSVLSQMISSGLINRLSVCETIEDFGCPERFNSYDLSDVLFAKSMLKKIVANPGEINVETDEELKQIVKIIMKKYLMEEPSTEQKSKVSIQVLVPSFINKDTNTSVPNTRKIQVVSYANEFKDGNPRLKDPSGTIEEGETPLQAGIREIEEELGLIISGLEFVEQKDNLYKYRLVLNETEYLDYIKKVNTLDIDPEITMIVVVPY